MMATAAKTAKADKWGPELERHEAKYIVPASIVPEVRAFIRPFVYNDPNADGDPPEYIVTTVQLDDGRYSLYQAKEDEALSRFKLRIRTYGTSESQCPAFLEIKRKIHGVIVKSRATVKRADWYDSLCYKPAHALPFKSEKETFAYLNFVRLVNEIGARPVLKVRYHRESYLGTYDNYSRVTFDRRLCYSRATTWDPWTDDGRWWTMDSTMGLNRPEASVILELKTFADAPTWMLDLARRFDLVRVGFCKYFCAVRHETLFTGGEYSDAAENCTYF